MSIYSASMDDNDPAIIYSPVGDWELITSDPPWTGTMHSTSIPGSYARFRFTGSRVAIICIIPTGDGGSTRATVSIDNGAPISVSHVTTPPVQYQVVLWDSGPLPYASHLVTLTDAGTEAYLRLDRIDYDPTDHNAPSQSSQSLPTSTTVLTTTVQQPSSSQIPISSLSISPSGSVTTTSSSGLSMSVQTVYLSPSASVSGSPAVLPVSGTSGFSDRLNASTNRSVPTFAIVGGILGALIFILLLAILLIFLRQRRKKSHLQAPLETSQSQQPGNETVPNPFQMLYSESSSSRASNSIPMVERKDLDGTHGASYSIYGSMSPTSPSSSTSVAPFLRSDVSTHRSTSFERSRNDVQMGSISAKGTMPSGGRATFSPADNRNTMTTYLADPPPAYGDVM